MGRTGFEPVNKALRSSLNIDSAEKPRLLTVAEFKLLEVVFMQIIFIH